jgi:hypothetical protein
MEGGEGIDEGARASFAARAVAPNAGEARRHDTGECLNCGTTLIGDFCHRCGQQRHVHRTLGAFWHALAHGVLHFEGKIWRTLPMLAWRPGELTRRYADGERARFVSPMALFLFSVFLMFALFSLMGAPLISVEGDPAGEAAAGFRQIDQGIKELEEQRLVLASEGRTTNEVDAELREARAARDLLAAANGIRSGRPVLDSELKTGWQRLDKGIAKANRNPALLFYKLQTNAYKFSWALIPISVPFLWLLFLHKGRYRAEHRVFDHVVFVTYSIAFFSLLGIGLVLLGLLGIPNEALGIAFLLISPIHMYRQLRGAYRLSRTSALWRTFMLLIFALVASTLFLLLLLALGVLG